LLARYAVTSQCHHTERPTYLGPTAINDTEKDPVTNSMRPEKIKEGRRQTRRGEAQKVRGDDERRACRRCATEEKNR